jgi:RNase adapter protein RapZ
MKIFEQGPIVKQRNVVIITGCSGSGKSTALATFEDAGFYCVDNMPVSLVRAFLEQRRPSKMEIAGWAFCMDMRDPNFLAELAPLRRDLKKLNYLVTIVFLEAAEKILLRRYSQTRRHHPLGHGGSLTEAIRLEKQELLTLREQADHVLDTSYFSVHELKFTILNIAQKHTAITGMAINVVSFGFKHGAPSDADMIMDVRFLANPYFVPELKTKSGEVAAVRQFVLSSPTTTQFLDNYLSLLDYLLPLYEKEGKAYLTIAIGCTGGRHRSVVIAQEIYDHILPVRSTVRLIHRDIQFV